MVVQLCFNVSRLDPQLQKYGKENQNYDAFLSAFVFPRLILKNRLLTCSLVSTKTFTKEVSGTSINKIKYFYKLYFLFTYTLFILYLHVISLVYHKHSPLQYPITF